jgi:hypothetical protein
MKRSRAFLVYLDNKLIDTVYYSIDFYCDEESIKNDLINHDGYNPSIEVFEKK